MLFLLSRRCKDSRHIVFLKHVIVHFFPSLLKYKCISESPEDELLFCDRSFMSCLFGSVSKQVFVRNRSFENETHFHMKGFARRLVLKQRHRVAWKWPIWSRRYSPLSSPLLHSPLLYSPRYFAFICNTWSRVVVRGLTTRSFFTTVTSLLGEWNFTTKPGAFEKTPCKPSTLMLYPWLLDCDSKLVLLDGPM